MAMDTEFSALMDAVCDGLLEGQIWHEKSASETRKIAVRGLGRWHDTESECDGHSRLCLEKLLRDRLGHFPKMDASIAEKALGYSIGGLGDLKKHLQVWNDREARFAKMLTEAVRASVAVDMAIYKELCDLLSEVQDEAMRTRLLMMRLDMAEWAPHDIGICSMLIHKFFEEHPGEKYVNINLG